VSGTIRIPRSLGEEFASAAAQAGITYPELLQRLLSLGLKGSAFEE
jgi:hypothetical protein